MYLEIDSFEKQILITALRQLEKVSTDSTEANTICSLREKVEDCIPQDRRISYMDEESNLFVDGEPVTPSDLGLHIS